jgi:hypothetical protein
LTRSNKQRPAAVTAPAKIAAAAGRLFLFRFEERMAKTQTQTFNVADDPTVAAERAKLVDIQTKLNAANRQLTAADNDETPKRTAFDVAVDRELGRESVATVRLAPDEARQRVRILEAALQEQRRIVMDAERDASQRMAAEALPRHKAIVKHMASAMAELRQAAIDERDFREALAAGDVRLGDTIRPFPVSGSLRPGQTDLFDNWLAEARQHYGI